ncbi:hypothetical protein PCANC_11179 [Puccinia coronata f. sp. avenae]|uniref:Uncharacterized protein n=1 Tax=Puccinia coronata f. sp. avenae TaxID=200324 RepID=A0A2N5URD5_9BASI|nr:hypothetical protein PCASD_25412 [Puccinia coronata f. sp. avenae]PLW16522.1 hypothetical protein PCANC_11729 [Puccinia coronata f. sp. avenae]PLW38876.1 hypothetical protein PCASD_09874 [Puccinia coronata f. sp. avenae]PLW40314.1 hypothetical protein PCANC_11179 [Puccinia coronata f. sp. avenae]
MRVSLWRGVVLWARCPSSPPFVPHHSNGGYGQRGTLMTEGGRISRLVQLSSVANANIHALMTSSLGGHAIGCIDTTTRGTPHEDHSSIKPHRVILSTQTPPTQSAA